MRKHVLFSEPPLYNFDVRVGSAGNPANFDPEAMALCTHYSGNVMPGDSVSVTCDVPVVGRYVMVYMPGDGFQGAEAVLNF